LMFFLKFLYIIFLVPVNIFYKLKERNHLFCLPVCEISVEEYFLAFTLLIIILARRYKIGFFLII
jgi:hypothetical protein